MDYLLEENRALRAAHGPRRLRLTDDQRRRLAVKGQVLGRRCLAAVAGIVTPDTILRWYRRLVAKKYDEAWMTQVVRNLTDARDGFLRNVQYLILDRDPLYTATFRRLLRDSGVTPLVLPAWSQNLNAYAERFVGSAKSSAWCESCHSAKGTFARPYASSYIINHEERPHQGLGNRRIAPETTLIGTGPVQCRKRLGGVLKFYYREAASRHHGRSFRTQRDRQIAHGAILARSCDSEKR